MFQTPFKDHLGKRVICMMRDRYQYRGLFIEERGAFAYLTDVSHVIDHDAARVKEEIKIGDSLTHRDRRHREHVS